MTAILSLIHRINCSLFKVILWPYRIGLHAYTQTHTHYLPLRSHPVPYSPPCGLWTYNDLALQVHKISGVLTSLLIHNSVSTYFFTLFMINIILHILSTTITFQKYISTSHHLITYHNTSWVIILLIAHFMKCSNWGTQNYLLLCNKLIIFILFPKVYMPTPLLVPYFFFYCHVLLLHNLLCFFVDSVILLPYH